MAQRPLLRLTRSCLFRGCCVTYVIDSVLGSLNCVPRPKFFVLGLNQLDFSESEIFIRILYRCCCKGLMLRFSVTLERVKTRYFVLYQLSYFPMAGKLGFEPRTTSLKAIVNCCESLKVRIVCTNILYLDTIFGFFVNVKK